MTTIYAKTRKGMDELFARKPSISHALNSVLIIVDGVRSETELKPLIEVARAPADSLSILLHGGYIEARVVSVASMVKPATTDAQMKAREQQSAARHEEKNAVDEQNTTAFLSTYNHMVGEAKKHLGIRGFGLQLKLERAKTIDDLRTLIGPLSEAVAKSHGLQIANNFVRDCDELMNAAEIRKAGQQLVSEARALEERRAKLRRVA